MFTFWLFWNRTGKKHAMCALLLQLLYLCCGLRWVSGSYHLPSLGRNTHSTVYSEWWWARNLLHNFWECHTPLKNSIFSFGCYKVAPWNSVFCLLNGWVTILPIVRFSFGLVLGYPWCSIALVTSASLIMWPLMTFWIRKFFFRRNFSLKTTALLRQY